MENLRIKSAFITMVGLGSGLLGDGQLHIETQWSKGRMDSAGALLPCLLQYLSLLYCKLRPPTMPLTMCFGLMSCLAEGWAASYWLLGPSDGQTTI